MTTYPGGKAGAGVWQTLVNELPPHREYIAAFAGLDAIARHKRPAERTVLIDLNERTLRRLWELVDFEGVELVHADALAWLRHRFNLDRLQPPPASPRDPAAPAGSQPGDDVVVYLDPPYPHSTRSKQKIYTFEMEDDAHTRLLQIATQLPCLVVASSYWNAAYDCAFSRWRCITYQAQTRGGPRTECVWLNFPPADHLHDSRHVGDDKRERERIRRRARNLVAGLKRASPRERQAMIDAVSNLNQKGP